MSKEQAPVDIDDSAKIATLLSAASGVVVTAADYQAWFDGEGDGNDVLFDEAVLRFLGEGASTQGSNLARLDNLLRYVLKLGEPYMCGGIDLHAILTNWNSPALKYVEG